MLKTRNRIEFETNVLWKRNYTLGNTKIDSKNIWKKQKNYKKWDYFHYQFIIQTFQLDSKLKKKISRASHGVAWFFCSESVKGATKKMSWYISNQGLQNAVKHKYDYKTVDLSLTTRVMSGFWVKSCEMLPMWLAYVRFIYQFFLHSLLSHHSRFLLIFSPNVITAIAFVQIVFFWFLTMWYAPTLTETLPTWLIICNGIRYRIIFFSICTNNNYCLLINNNAL